MAAASRAVAETETIPAIASSLRTRASVVGCVLKICSKLEHRIEKALQLAILLVALLKLAHLVGASADVEYQIGEVRQNVM